VRLSVTQHGNIFFFVQGQMSIVIAICQPRMALQMFSFDFQVASNGNTFEQPLQQRALGCDWRAFQPTCFVEKTFGSPISVQRRLDLFHSKMSRHQGP